MNAAVIAIERIARDVNASTVLRAYLFEQLRPRRSAPAGSRSLARKRVGFARSLAKQRLRVDVATRVPSRSTMKATPVRLTSRPRTNSVSAVSGMSVATTPRCARCWLNTGLPG